MNEPQSIAGEPAPPPAAPLRPSMRETLDRARWLVHERGFSVIALDHPQAPLASRADQVGKIPIASWKAFQTCPPTDVNLVAWFGNGTARNIGIVTGVISGIVVVDCDSAEAEAWASRNLPPTPMMTRTAKGTHRFYRHPGRPVPNKARIIDPDLALDVRGDGGYVVAPGSTHHTGNIYERIGSWPEIEKLPVFDITWLLPLRAEDSAASARPVVPDPGDEGTDCRDRRVAPARAYVARIPGAVEGQGGDHQTYVVACHLVRDFDLDLVDAKALLSEWNSTCQPPWSDRELDAKLDHALKYGAGSVGSKAGCQPSSRRTTGAGHSGESGAVPAPRLTLDPAAPLQSAQAFLERHHRVDGVLALRHHGGVFSRFLPGVNTYADVDEAGVRADVYGFLETTDMVTKSGANAPFNPTKSKVENVMDAVRAEAHLTARLQPPLWLNGDPGIDPRDILPTTGGLLHLGTRRVMPGTANFFAKAGVAFAYDPAAPIPTLWLRFLNQLWPGDEQSQQVLQEFFGYALTPRTHFQKMLLIVGPKRGGKGTIGRVLRQLLGPEHVCAPTLASLGTQFGMSTLIDKPLAIISDARIGGRTDTSVVVERLLSISGEDTISVPRKFLPDWTGPLPTRFMVLTNELPRIEDSAGAFISRFIVLTLRESFFGKEDHELSERLMLELPGILNWALDGLDRLRARGRFVQPSAADDMIREFEELSSPIAAFVRDRCRLDAGACTPCDQLFAEWGHWCLASGREHPGTVQTFGRNLRAAVPAIGDSRPNIGDKRVRCYDGIRLRLPSEDEE